jgi:hypothetical protein
MTVRIEVKFKVNSVGTVPLSISIGPTFGTAVLHLMGRSKLLMGSVIVYQFGKVLLAAHKLGPDQLRRFINECKNFKMWDFDVKAGRKGLTMDFSKVAKLYAMDREQGKKYLKQYAEILSCSGGVKTDKVPR